MIEIKIPLRFPDRLWFDPSIKEKCDWDLNCGIGNFLITSISDPQPNKELKWGWNVCIKCLETNWHIDMKLVKEWFQKQEPSFLLEFDL